MLLHLHTFRAVSLTVAFLARLKALPLLRAALGLNCRQVLPNLYPLKKGVTVTVVCPSLSLPLVFIPQDPCCLIGLLLYPWGLLAIQRVLKVHLVCLRQAPRAGLALS